MFSLPCHKLRVPHGRHPAHVTKTDILSAVFVCVQKEMSLYETERALTHRAALCEQTLARMVPSVDTTAEKRLKSPKILNAENASRLQIALAEHMVSSLHDEVRAVRRELNAKSAGTAYEAMVLTSSQDVVPALVKLIGFTPPGSSLDLSGFNLSYCDLDGSMLADTKCHRTVLNGATMRGASLLNNQTFAGAALVSANLTDAVLAGCDLAGARLASACVQKARAAGADLTGADISRADMSGCDLRDAKLDDATVSFTNFASADLRGASLRGLRLAGVDGLHSCTLDNLRGAVFAGADMRDIDLRGVDVSGAVIKDALFLEQALLDNLRGASLAGASLDGVDLSSIDLSGADLCGCSLEGALLTEPVLAHGARVEAYPAGDAQSVRAGSIVYHSGFLVRCTADHPSSAEYTYYGDAQHAWAAVSRAGCFRKSECRVLLS